MVTKFKHPSQDYYVYVILDICRMLKLARNALGSIKSFYDKDGGEIQWSFFQQLYNLQEAEGLPWATSSPHNIYSLRNTK